MDRGVFVGGGLIGTSFLMAVLLNDSAPERTSEPVEVRAGIEEECPPVSLALPEPTPAAPARVVAPPTRNVQGCD